MFSNRGSGPDFMDPALPALKVNMMLGTGSGNSMPLKLTVVGMVLTWVVALLVVADDVYEWVAAAGDDKAQAQGAAGVPAESPGKFSTAEVTPAGRNAPWEPISRTGGRVFLPQGVVAHLRRCPASPCDARLALAQNHPGQMVPFGRIVLSGAGRRLRRRISGRISAS